MGGEGRWKMGDGSRGRSPHQSNIQHRTSNIEHPTSNIQHRTPNIEHPTSNTQHRTPNIQSENSPAGRRGVSWHCSPDRGCAESQPQRVVIQEAAEYLAVRLD